ncbi:GNAT family N-acetyltransferase [Phytohabitans sp. ZYX-F-186]|uniref:GNAT family N-acetyltransferase n=1 Tax=Phytohabitans maris TaxID=3071409 RepID=A0ABU0ZR64_9ACTN|nr:GNAT family N-acetyltransferase [Phytohabitans sp. ZYX-F-186]MDQ7909508.1 GNAT family N-acetyltransferase [Phytohabitans sp. ZYX-F-186]
MRDAELTWGPLDGDREAVAALAGRCHAADGGMPEVTISRFAADGVLTTGARTATGLLVAAGAIRPLRPGAAFIGLVDPDYRGAGIGGALLDWGLAAAAADGGVLASGGASASGGLLASGVGDGGVPASGGASASGGALASGAGGALASGEVAASGGVPASGGLLASGVAGGGGVPASGVAGGGGVPASGVAGGGGVPASGVAGGGGVPAGGGGGGVMVETEALTEAAGRLFASRGLRQVFAEDVMRFDLAAAEPPAVPLPPGLVLHEWTPDLAARFFAAYEAAFRERPGFPSWPAERWVAWTAGDEEFRPQWSLLAAGPDGEGDAGFVTCAEGWIVQVGVAPSWRGRGVGGALVAEALRRMRAEGADHALLDVNVDNPAAHLYARLGFTRVGRRAKFQR